jgi:hypothetical protein
VVGSYKAIIRIKRHFRRTGLCPKHPIHMSRGWIEATTPIHALRYRGSVAATTQTSRGQMREYHGCLIPREGKSLPACKYSANQQIPEPPDRLSDYTTCPQTARLSKTRSLSSSRARRPKLPICSRNKPTSLWLLQKDAEHVNSSPPIPRFHKDAVVKSLLPMSLYIFPFRYVLPLSRYSKADGKGTS